MDNAITRNHLYVFLDMVFSAFFSAHKVIQKNHNEQTIIKNIQVSHDGICKEFIPRNPNAWEKSPTA